MNALEDDILVELEKLRDCMLMLHKPYCVPSYHEQVRTTRSRLALSRLLLTHSLTPPLLTAPSSYHEQLCTCVFHFIGLDLTGHFRASYILGLLKLWPWLDSDKEECFLLELEELLDFMSPEEEKVSGGGAAPVVRPPAFPPAFPPALLPC